MRDPGNSGHPDQSGHGQRGSIEALQEHVDALEHQSKTTKRAHQEAMRRERQLRTHNAVLAQLSMNALREGCDEHVARREIVTAAADALNVSRVGIWLFGDDGQTLRAVELFDRQGGFARCQTVIRADRYPRYFEALRENRTLPAHDVHRDSRTKELLHDYLEPCGITSMLDAPVRIGGKLVGVICHEHIGPQREWTLDEQTFAGSMGDFVSLSLQMGKRNEMEAAIKRQREYLRQIIDISPNLVFVLDEETRFVLANKALCDLVSVPHQELIGNSAMNLIKDQEQARRLRKMDEAILRQSQLSIDCEESFTDRDGKQRWFHLIKRPITSVDGSGKQVLGVASDVTERKLYQEHLASMVRELDHRVKNNLFAVMIMAEHTAMGSNDIDEYLHAFNGRMRSMAIGHEILAKTNWQGAMLVEVINSLIRPYVGENLRHVTLDGPDVMLPARVAPAMCMMIHELITNAMQHGALSLEEGRVDVLWKVEDQTLHMNWIEHGTQDVAQFPQRGFGMELIERTAAHQLRGDAQLSFEPPGLRCELNIPLKLPADRHE